jgi:hypothetical protein
MSSAHGLRASGTGPRLSASGTKYAVIGAAYEPPGHAAAMSPRRRWRPRCVRGREILVTVVLVRGADEVASWPLVGRAPDVDVAGQLARLSLAAHRAGCTVRLRGACPRLRELLDLVGLTGVLAGDG